MAKSRRRMSKKGSRRSFSNNAIPLKINQPRRIMRGGFRL